MKSIHLNQQPLCEERSSESRLSFSQCWLTLVSFLQRSHHRLYAFVSREIPAGLSALINSGTVNARRYLGLACIGVFAPLSTVLYRLFDSAIIDKSWYHVNYYYLLHVLGIHSFQAFFWVVGLFLITPKKYSPEYWIGPFIGYPIIKAVLIINCTSNEMWHESIHWSLFIAMGLIGLCIAFGINFFSWVKFHKHDGLIARMDGLFKTPFKDDEKVSLLFKTWTDLKTFKKEF
jgi:hypothetical protein